MLTPPLIAPTLVVHSWGGTDSPVEVRPRARDQNATQSRMSTLVVHPSRIEPTKLCFRNWLGCTASLVPERFREKLERWATPTELSARLTPYPLGAIHRGPQARGTHAPSPLTRRSTVHTLPVFSADVALSIALDAQSVAGQIGVTCRGASLKVRGCRLSRALRTRCRGAGGCPYGGGHPSSAPLYPSQPALRPSALLRWDHQTGSSARLAPRRGLQTGSRP